MKQLDEQETWQVALGELEIVFSHANYATWFKDTFISSIGAEEIIIGVPNAFTKEWLEKKYHEQILATLKKLHPETKTVKYSVLTKQNVSGIPNTPKTASLSQEANRTAAKAEPLRNVNDHPTINPKHTFDNFIVGNSNRLAAATAQAVANQPGTLYNPLFIYGGVGLGKTHLVQAIANEILKKGINKKIVYLSAENFTNDFVQSISSGKIKEFKKKYRDADVLLIDDIQFLAGKDGTQEEFFYTFNTLHQTDRQIVITSDRVPKAIPQLQERLSSRFGCGMVADVQAPNLEMRQAILRTKAAEKNFRMDENVINYVAQNLESNIRELEGAVNRIITYCELNNLVPSLDIVTNILGDMIGAKNKILTVEKLVKVVGGFFNLSSDDLLSAKRNKELVWPRQILMYLMRHELNLSYPKIGKELNKKDHTTIMHGVLKIEKEIAKNDNLQKELSMIKEQLYAN